MAWYPGAIRKEITKHRTPLRVTNRAVILHVAVSEADSLYGYFSGAVVASHFYVRKTGVVEQYVDTRFSAPANLYANSSAYSIETQGGVRNANSEKWTEAQENALASLVRWLQQTHGVPRLVMPNSRPASRGVGHHRLGVDPYRVSGGELWSTAYGKICPGLGKISQIPGIVRLSGGAAIPVSNPGNLLPGSVAYGSTGKRVRELQTMLKAQYSKSMEVDGVFGSQTRTVVRSYQGSRGLVIDGIAGPATFKALETKKPPVSSKPKPPPSAGPRTLNRGDTGQDVRTLQKLLNDKFPSYSRLVVDGVFGPATEAVIEEFQRKNKITPSGDYGPKTRAALEKAIPEPRKSVKPKPAKLKIDGVLGRATISQWQRVMGTPVDGVISEKDPLVVKMQKHLISKGISVGPDGADGVLGSDTIKGLQRYLKTPVDGVISKPSSRLIMALQKRLNTGKF